MWKRKMSIFAVKMVVMGMVIIVVDDDYIAIMTIMSMVMIMMMHISNHVSEVYPDNC